MLSHQSNSKATLRLFCAAALATAMWSAISPAQTVQRPKPSAEKTTSLVGRPLAWKLPLFLGAGVGPLSEVFVFSVERGGAEGTAATKIVYTFSEPQGLLPNNFFDYLKRYELQVVRDPKCDETVNTFSYVKSVDHASGKPLPPDYVLRFSDGAPKDALKPDSILACYILRPGRYKVLSQKKDAAPSTPTTR